MKYFFILIIFAATNIINGEEPKEEEHLVITTRMPDLGEDTFNRKVGACTYKEILYDTDVCQRRFYLSFRTNPKTPCKKRHDPLEKCLIKKIASCFRPVLSAEKFKDIMQKYRSSMESVRPYHCGLKKYKVTEFLKEGVKNKKCTSKFPQKIDKCPSSYLKLFMKSPGDLRLCSEYSKNTKCMKKAIETYCSFDFSKSNWIFDYKLNPFCDKKQLEELERNKE